MVENYDKIFKKTLEGLTNRPRLLLHACCAPCSSSVLERLVPHFDVTLYFYNPNIDDDGEYDLRLKDNDSLISRPFHPLPPIFRDIIAE